MSKGNFKTVMFPIQVPKGKYCWKYSEDGAICKHLSSEFGDECVLGLDGGGFLESNSDGVLKPHKCNMLMEEFV